MSTQSGKIRDDEGKEKEQKETPEETLTTSPTMIVGENIDIWETVNDTRKNIKEDAEKLSKIKQGKYGNKPLDG